MPASAVRRLRVAGGLLAAACAGLAAWLLLGGGPASSPPEVVPAGTAAAVVERPALPGLPKPPSPPAPPPAPAAAPAPPAPPAEPEPPAEPPDPLAVPLRAVVRDATTGRTVAGVTLALLAGREEKRVPLRAEGDRHLLAASPLRRGESASLHFEARLPEGFVAEWKDALWVTGTVARLSAEVEAVLVVWPEARVRLRVEEADGSPVKGAVLQWATAGAGSIEARAEPTDARGETRIRGVPWILGEKVVALAVFDDRWSTSKPSALPGRGPGAVEECLVRVVLPGEVSTESIGIGGGGAGGMFGGRRGGGRNLIVAGPGTGVLSVRVSRRDGRPAPGVRVVVGDLQQEADGEGNARFQAVAAGASLVAVREPGFYAEPVTVSVVAGSEAFAELRQSEGAVLDVRVLDAGGLPAAGASLEVTLPDGLPYCLMEGDTQILGLFADADGRARLPGLPPGTVRVKARFGTRTAAVESAAGGPMEIRLPPVP